MASESQPENAAKKKKMLLGYEFFYIEYHWRHSVTGGVDYWFDCFFVVKKENSYLVVVSKYPAPARPLAWTIRRPAPAGW